ncbi:hypothetical protein CIB84_016272 [Bambusicola thoracicus]|uniref:Carbohydrate sulfotransferase n=1 Tax=Bambusicola thoracicus TaxID=9083 RepID=A0A2P4S7A3_BAMTH|nr:hypothetical protein CIB84_016272 [Bambusicola thoracicus]
MASWGRGRGLESELGLNLYFKFFIVRDPFERLISAFKDKFVHNPRFEPWYRHEIAPSIIRKYRRNRMETKGLQFEDFVRYLGDPNHRWLDVQFGDHIIHWVTYVELCAPCEITYSVIGHHETLEDDAPYILKAAGIDRLVSYPTIPPGITVYNKTKVERQNAISKRCEVFIKMAVSLQVDADVCVSSMIHAHEKGTQSPMSFEN